jgi:sterol desaturase/sphingolipid hydroxylase (fatty acid hydroxylase superfamily)
VGVALTVHTFLFNWLALFGIIIARYFLIAGGTYWLFYSLLGKSPVTGTPIEVDRPIYGDIALAVSSASVFAAGAAGIVMGYDSGITLLYGDVARYGTLYTAASFVSVLVLQDTYFYFLHRLFHHPSLFRWVHSGHHRSGKPTPWTSFAFDLPEAFVQTLFFVGIVFIVPLHYLTLIAVLLTGTVWAVWNHLGFELFSPSFPVRQGRSGEWLVGSAHHAIHHRRYGVHYGLYFTFWDRVCRTRPEDARNETGKDSREVGDDYRARD